MIAPAVSKYPGSRSKPLSGIGTIQIQVNMFFLTWQLSALGDSSATAALYSTFLVLKRGIIYHKYTHPSTNDGPGREEEGAPSASARRYPNYHSPHISSSTSSRSESPRRLGETRGTWGTAPRGRPGQTFWKKHGKDYYQCFRSGNGSGFFWPIRTFTNPETDTFVFFVLIY